MATVLDEIVARTRLKVAERKAAADLPELERAAARHAPRGFAAGLRRVGREGTAVIAEMKRASPSKGMLREEYRPAAIANAYAQAGAAAISVLTDEEFFQGSLKHLSEVSRVVKVPVLRKDFMVDAFQVVEARAAGADAVLLIVASHTDAGLRELGAEAARWELDVLCEVHDPEEARRAAGLGFQTIGVNCRDLKTMQVDPAAHERMAGWLPENVLRVAESGIRTRGDIERLQGVGYEAFLVGETLMRQADPGAGLRALLGEDSGAEKLRSEEL